MFSSFFSIYDWCPPAKEAAVNVQRAIQDESRNHNLSILPLSPPSCTFPFVAVLLWFFILCCRPPVLFNSFSIALLYLFSLCRYPMYFFSLCCLSPVLSNPLSPPSFTFPQKVLQTIFFLYKMGHFQKMVITIVFQLLLRCSISLLECSSWNGSGDSSSVLTRSLDTPPTPLIPFLKKQHANP